MLMILGIGVDITQNKRFDGWQNRSKEQLLHVFTEQELNLTADMNEQQKIEFYASRFAAKEAFYKAFSSALVKFKIHERTSKTFNFLFACKYINISSGIFDTPLVNISLIPFSELLGCNIPEFKTELSFSHEKDFSIAFVVIYN